MFVALWILVPMAVLAAIGLAVVGLFAWGICDDAHDEDYD